MDILFMFLAVLLLLVAFILLARKVERLTERVNNIEFIVQIVRAAYNADKTEKMLK